ncbi:DUF1648 domain-containing protein [Neobacillus mesonae]|uniref:DUF1648 domain-containing protein n=1 Tax=Neobacillus mesonae TaxID=1193713 RepID=UPI00203EF0CF|nr:DUF1648 domain-containing protein [Neobacillus mesonae]MCM3570693.1 DUF1648 domain-containing protein [Neobacillus mesonae]
MSNYRGRPKLNIPKSKREWIWDISGYLCYIGSIILLLAVWRMLPDEVPGHYNAAGEVDRWGSKWELLLFPFISAFILILMSVLEKFPEAHNYPQRLNESNAEQFYIHSRKVLNQIKNICLIIFSLVEYESISIALGWGSGFGQWFLPIIIIGTGIPIVLGMINQRRIR